MPDEIDKKNKQKKQNYRKKDNGYSNRHKQMFELGWERKNEMPCISQFVSLAL